ncbi:MAG TPA: DUF2662 domain-containing protein [Actinobacteria bacterium]|nr:DUF2662 domain-containing protein [Actinomycetes bacterium]HEX21652.1 DUF2662 domain-containing protein [Actinomycetota bacterium]
MAIFQEIEKRLENLFEGFFNRQFKSALQPVELAKKLTKEMDRSKTVGIEEIYAPNNYQVFLSESDYEKISAFSESLASELKSYLVAQAQAKQYRLPAGLVINFAVDASLKLGEVRITSSLVEDANPRTDNADVGGHTQILSPAEAAELGLYASKKEAVLIHLETGKRFALKGETIYIGRQANNDMVVDDPSVSRRHARLEREGPSYVITDLNSTNGTQINQIPITTGVLEDEDCLTLGKSNFIFRS